MENDNQQELQTPGVYLNESSAFPNPSLINYNTAVPAFVGYTARASYNGKSFLNVPVKVTSFAEFQAFFCEPKPASPADPAQQYSPQYYLVPQQSKPQSGDYLILELTYYSVLPDPATIYYFYNSIRLFFQNGGQTAYIVSVGTYGQPSGKPMNPGDPLINPNIQLNDLLNGLNALVHENEPTMYLVPEATLLSTDNNATLMQSMLLQCSQLGTAISIFDVIGGKNPDPNNFMEDISTFRNNTGANGLNYGTCYYPFIGTTTMQPNELNFTNLFGGDINQLAPRLRTVGIPNPDVENILAQIQAGNSGKTNNQLNTALLAASPIYTQIMQLVLADCNLLPASTALAGVITTVDNEIGPWQAPANLSIIGAVSLPIQLNNTQQASLNVDPSAGKSINALRFFAGRGILIWGARTLDGDSQDWRYISVRRTMIYLEQACKQIAFNYVFEPNDSNTWELVTAQINTFLTDIWKQGGLQGSSTKEAFFVQCGIGSTMTSHDILNGIMNITIEVAPVHPAEFVVISIQQQQASSSLNS